MRKLLVKGRTVLKLLLGGFFLSFVVCSLSSCTKESESSGSPSSGTNSGSRASASEFTTDCGTVIDGKIKNPVSQSEGILVSVEPVASNLLIIEELGPQAQPGKQLIKLHGVAPGDAAYASTAIDLLRTLGRSAVYFYKAASDCSTVVAGQTGSIGQLISSNGRSFSEEILRAGLAAVDPNDACGGEQIGSCLQALKPETPHNAGPLDEFLWKPVSDSNGKLAVHTGPYGTTVIVNGELGDNQGPGNGYGSLARFSRAGCGYPSPRVQVLDSDGVPYTVGGKTVFTVPNPCSRNCLHGGAISPCSK